MIKGGGQQLDNNTAILCLRLKSKRDPGASWQQAIVSAKISITITASFAIVGFDVSQKAVALKLTLPGFETHLATIKSYTAL